MCGILIHVGRKKFNPIELDIFLSQSIKMILSRGPDGQGANGLDCSGFFVAFAHTRLSVIDTSSQGHQPMHDAESDLCITYNGEIYNYIEIRNELRAHGYSFFGNSDTEVLLKAWAHWGAGALTRLNGMFAFAVLNKRTGELWLARDRFGVKPLLWGRTPEGGLVFSSSAAVVANHLAAEVSSDYCAHGLRFKAFETPGSESPFLGVNAIPAGSWLKVKFSNESFVISEGYWYDLKQAVENKRSEIMASSDEDLLRQCEYLLHDAVKIRLRSDVPLAVSLSAGVDSSSIAAIASRHVADLKGFTYGLPQALQSEGPAVAEFAKKMGIDAHYIWPKHDAGGLDTLLERVLECQEAPFPGLSVLAQNEVFNSVRQAGVKVLLGGQGGDECFAGYRKFFIVAARDAFKRRDVIGALHMVYSLGLMLMNEAGQAKHYWRALGRYREKSEFEFDLLDFRAPTANLWGRAGITLADRQTEDIQKWSIPSLLRYEDRNSMGNGVETRLPFMDYRLVEMALALPARLKVANGYGKWALRNVISGVVPDEIRLNRKKRGFDVTQSWIEDGIGASLRSRIQSNKSTLSPYIKKGLNLSALLSDDALKKNSNLLDEALMLAWLVKPVRSPSSSGVCA